MDDLKDIGEWKKILDLGSGAFGVVSLWRNTKTDDSIAIKRCKFESKNSLSPRQKQRWVNEVDIMKNIHHPNIISYKEIPEALRKGLEKINPTKLPLLSMEYCDKGNLRTVLKQTKNCCGLQESDIRDCLADVCSGVEFLHKSHITHRDIKPDNIVLNGCNSRKNNTVYKIIDLGYAKDISDTVVSFVGTLDYLAPEICLGKQYNSSVDYWSLGVLSFEIICGVNPFLPGKFPSERFMHIQKKEPDVICIYESDASGSFESSKNLLKYNFISNCLKLDLEIWLRHVLQFDALKRSQNFPNDITVFQFIKNVLEKRIINVFWLDKLELCSYEINESTLIGTLKDWIQRDMKVPKENIVVLFSKNINPIPDDKFVIDYLTENNNVYVVRKGSFFNADNAFNFPYYVKKLFERKITFGSKEMMKLCHQSIFYLHNENKTIIYTKKSINLFIRYVKNLCLGAMEKFKITESNFEAVLTILDDINVSLKNNCDINLQINEETKDCFRKYNEVLGTVERYFKGKKNLELHLQMTFAKSNKLAEYYSKIDEEMRKCDLETSVQNFITTVEKNKSLNSEQLLNIIAKELSQAIKIKDKFLCNEVIANYIKALHDILNKIEFLIKCMFEMDKCVNDLRKDIPTEKLKNIRWGPKKLVVATPVKNGFITGRLDKEVLINDTLRRDWDVIINNIFCNDLLLYKFE